MIAAPCLIVVTAAIVTGTAAAVHIASAAMRVMSV
jgi:hypothetical protein